MESKNKPEFTKKELLELVKKRSNRGLTRNKIEGFVNIFNTSENIIGSGIFAFTLMLIFGLIGAIKPLNIIKKNKRHNKILNFFIHFFFWWILFPIRFIMKFR